MLKTRPIDKALYELEKVADTKGLYLEDVLGYVELCEFLTDLDIYGCSTKGFDKAACVDVLKACIVHVFPTLADNPMWWFHHKIVEVYYNDHR